MLHTTQRAIKTSNILDTVVRHGSCNTQYGLVNKVHIIYYGNRNIKTKDVTERLVSIHTHRIIYNTVTSATLTHNSQG